MWDLEFERNGPSQEAWRIYEECINPGDTVVGVGVSHTIFRDPTLAEAAFFAGETGQAYIADPIYSFGDMDGMRGSIGIGSVSSYQDDMSTLKWAGVPLAPSTWLGFESNVFDIKVSAHVVIDHATSFYIYGASRRSQIPFNRFFGKVIQNYFTQHPNAPFVRTWVYW